MFDEGAKDLYLKPSMLHSVAANTEHPEASAMLVDFLINSEESGQIFGTNRGLPASTVALEAAELDELSEQIKQYEADIADRLRRPALCRSSATARSMQVPRARQGARLRHRDGRRGRQPVLH